MKTTLRSTIRITGPDIPFALTRGIGWGLLGGLAGTVAMDLVIIGASPALGLHGFASFSVIGDTAARFFALLGTKLAGGILTGLTVHYLVGPLLGAIFGAATVRVNALWPSTLKKGILLAILFIELVSQPLLATPPLLLNMTALQTAQWYILSFWMHLLCGVVLGLVVSYGLRSGSSRPA